MKKYWGVTLLLLLLAACGDFQWLPESAKYGLVLTPDKYTYLCPVTVNNPVESKEALTVSGIASPVAISVDKGEYSIDGGKYTSAAGTINNGQSVKVRPTGGTITTDNTTVTVTLTIGTTAIIFKATTGACQQTTTP